MFNLYDGEIHICEDCADDVDTFLKDEDTEAFYKKYPYMKSKAKWAPY